MKALVGAFSVIAQPVVEPMDRFTALPKDDPRIMKLDDDFMYEDPVNV